MTLRTAHAAVAARARIRTGDHIGPTSGLAEGLAQANLVMLPADYALDFLRFCVRNPKPGHMFIIDRVHAEFDCQEHPNDHP